MASVKISVPTGGKDSNAFTDALKVSIAATAYNSPVQWVKGTSSQKKRILIWGTDGKFSLENKKAKLILNDANSVVRYELKIHLVWLDIFMN